MRKSLILGMYAVVLYFVLKKYYANGNQGAPNPSTITAPTYLYAILAITADFLGAFPVVLGAGLTVALIWQAQGTKTITKTTTQKGK